MSDMLRKLIKELIDEELDETTSSAAAGPYNTPFAFRGNSAEGKAKQKKNSNQAGYEMVKGETDKADPAPEQKKNVVTFGEAAINEFGDKKKCRHCQNKTIAKDGICSDCRMKDFGKDYKSAMKEDSNLPSPSEKNAEGKPKHQCKTCDKMIAADRTHCSECAYSAYEYDNHRDGHDKDEDGRYDESVNENRYTDFRTSEGHPRQKIGKAIREINKQLHEIDGIMKMNARLKKESGLNNDQLWKSTVRGLSVLEGRLNTLATRIREMKG
jgi:hypothetical protein